MNKKNDSINYINDKELEFINEMLKDTLKYQKQYGFDIGQNNVAWNNEADAFRHAYMQSILSQRYSKFVAKRISEQHERQGNKNGQDFREANMDMWNNQQGQQIYDEIRKEYPNFSKFSKEQQKDIIANKVVQRIMSGLLITNLDDSRKFNEERKDLPYIPTRSVGGVQNNGKPLGFAAPIDTHDIESPLFRYTNPLTGNNRIFTREDISSMTNDEFENYEKEIMSQLKFIGIPTNGDMEREILTSGNVIYVKAYTRSDGTKVKGYYRSKPSF